MAHNRTKAIHFKGTDDCKMIRMYMSAERTMALWMDDIKSHKKRKTRLLTAQETRRRQLRPDETRTTWESM